MNDLLTDPWPHAEELADMLSRAHFVTAIGIEKAANPRIAVTYAAKHGGLEVHYLPNEWPMNPIAVALLDVKLQRSGTDPTKKHVKLTRWVPTALTDRDPTAFGADDHELDPGE